MSTFSYSILYSLSFVKWRRKVSLKGSSPKPPYFGIVFYFFFLFIIFRRIWNILIWFTTTHKLKELFGIFTYEWLIQICIFQYQSVHLLTSFNVIYFKSYIFWFYLCVITSNVMPFYTIFINVIEESHTSFNATVDIKL